jgi:ABC-type nitrate/sulfonate/bicarbonate transport system permease component
VTATAEVEPVARAARAADRHRSGVAWLPSALLIVGLLVLWEVAARTFLASSTVFPRLTDVVADVGGNVDIYRRHIATTVREAWTGWLVGNLVAVGLGVAAVAIPRAEKAVLQLAVAVTSLPIIALGPIFQVTLSGDAPKSALAGLAVFFTTLVGTIVGLRAADRSSLDVIRALGGSGVTTLRKVRVRAALPDFFAALRISAPAAVLGAIIGEFLGGNDNGLGLALVSAQASAQTAKVWAVALVATAVAGAGYALIALVGRMCTPWSDASRADAS